MKKILIIFLSLIILLAAFSTVAFAENGGEYLVFRDGESLVLSRDTGSGWERVATSESLSVILSELSSAEGTPRAVLDSIEVTGDVTLPQGSYVLSGTLSVSGGVLSVPCGCEVTLSSLSLSFSGGGCLRIKGGKTRVEDTRIVGDGVCAVLLDYSTGSQFELWSGDITGTYSDGAVSVKLGSLAVFGGAIRNLGGTAVVTDTGMRLSGAPEISGVVYGIKSSRVISLSGGGKEYSGTVKIAYDGSFSEGTLTEIFYNATPDEIEGIRVFDKEGKEYPLTCFDSSKHTSEKNFAAVYLPYSLKYFVNSELFYEDKYISGEMPSLISPPSRDGYTALGWYLDGEDARFSPEPLSSDLSLYSRYELLPPSFSISSLSFTYDGEAHSLSFDTLSHPLLDSGAFVTYEWKREGKLISSAPSPSFSRVSDSGVYSVTATLHFGGDSVSVTAENISVEILRAKLPSPKIPSAAYTGSRLYASPLPSALYSYTETFGIGAGSYPVSFTLKDTENYRWDSSDSDTVTVDFVIERAENAWAEPPGVSDVFLGAEPVIYGTALFGKSKVSYSKSEIGPYTDSLPSEAGEYFAILTVPESADYTGLVSEPMKFKISEDRVVSIRVERAAARGEYYAFEHFSPDGLLVIATYESGREEAVSPEKIKISYNGSDSLRATDRSVTLSYCGAFVAHPVSVSPAEYDLSGILFSDTEIIYDGKYHTVDSTLPEIVGLDGLPLRYTVSGGGTEAGSYGVTLSFFTDSKNYKVPDSRHATIRITPLFVTLVWSNTDFTYDGTAKLPTAAYTDVFGVKRYPRVSGTKYNAGEGYTATAVPDGKSYAFNNPECEFRIAKADYDLSGVYWSQSYFYYNGESHRVELLGLPTGIKVIGYTDAARADAGMYTARATVDYDSENYNAPTGLTHSWVIYPAQYDLSGFHFSDTEAVFDGEAHYPTLTGAMPCGLDGITLSYSFSRGVTHVAEGRVPVTVRFFTESKNYVAPKEITVFVSILPRGISVVWQGGEFIYDGSEKLPFAKSAECAVRVLGGSVDAGVYTARAESQNSDYYILNPEYEYEIKKAQNAWITPPSALDVYEGDAFSVFGEALAGEVLYKFFSDRDMLLPIAKPTLPGRYYAVAYVPESKNYLSVSSEVMPFEIIEVVPTELSLQLSDRVLFALSPITEGELSAYLVYNNGERRALDFSLLTIAYRTGDVLHFGDREVTVSYLGFTESIPVSVARIDYDLSGVRWQGTDAVYDGEAKCPTLTGLPDGVSVSFYEGYGTAAGEYSVKAHLAYDTQNYNAPKIEPATLVIRRRTVTPALPSVIYDGTPHIPTSDSPLYTVVGEGAVVAAGSYSFTVRLTDGKNYTFPSGEQATVIFTVLPRTLELELPDLTLYLFDSPSEIRFTSPEGTLSSDVVEIVGRIEGERVIYSLNNPNYTLAVSEGRVNRVPYPSPAFTWTMLFVILFILLIILAVLVVFYRYDDILAAFAAARCKRRMKTVLATPSGERTAPFEPVETPKACETAESVPEASLAIDAERADELITDSLAKDLLKRPREFVVTEGSRRGVINVDTLSKSFESGDEVDINILKEKNLVPYDTAYLKVLARGVIDKALSVRANDFSLAAIKMIALSGGEAIKVVTVKEKRGREN